MTKEQQWRQEEGQQWRVRHLPSDWLGYYDQNGRGGRGKRLLSMEGVVCIGGIMFIVCSFLGAILGY